MPRVPAEHLHAHLDPLFTTLFAVLDNPELPENEYVMKAIMRLLSLLGAHAAGITPMVLSKLTKIFEHGLVEDHRGSCPTLACI